MAYLKLVVGIAACALLAGCAEKPEASIEKSCVRLELFSEINSSADAKKSCSCLAGKLKEGMSEKDLKAFAKALKESKTGDDFEGKAEANGLSDMAGMTFLSAAKSCALE
jgi:hypothetical protein